MSIKKGIGEVLLALLTCLLFCMLLEALFAVFVRAFAPSNELIRIINAIIFLLGAFGSCLLFIRKGGALYKGLIAGALSVLLTALVFSLIGKVNLFTPWILLKLLGGGVFGALGGVLGVNIRKQ